MPIRNRNISKRSAGYNAGRNVQILIPPNASGSTYVVNGLAASAMTVGTALTVPAQQLVTVLVCAHSLIFTPGGAPTSPFTFSIVGENLFGDPINGELVTISGAGSVSSLHCYRKVTSITPTAKSSTGTDTMSIGWATAIAGLPRAAIPCKFKGIGSVKNVTMLGNYGTQPVFTVIGDPYWAVTWITNVPSSNPFGVAIAQMDERDPNI